MKLELGSGQRPTPGYVHNDLNAFDGIELVGNPWELDIATGVVDEVLALGVIEHLTYEQALKTFARVYDWLKPGATFLFDVPDIAVWCRYLVEGTDLFTPQHVLATLYGWQRWPGDEHKSGWTEDLLLSYLKTAGFFYAQATTEPFNVPVERGRFTREGDAHLYVMAIR